jgi:hypothetical protein
VLDHGSVPEAGKRNRLLSRYSKLSAATSGGRLCSLITVDTIVKVWRADFVEGKPIMHFMREQRISRNSAHGILRLCPGPEQTDLSSCRF